MEPDESIYVSHYLRIFLGKKDRRSCFPPNHYKMVLKLMKK